MRARVLIPEARLLCANWEGVARWAPALSRYVTYIDVAGCPTIGRGHKLTDQEKANGVFAKGLTATDCEKLFDVDCAPRFAAVCAALPDDMGDHVAGAVFVAVFNCGELFLKSTAVRLLIAGAPREQVSVAWCEWCDRLDPATGKKVVDAGLLNRRRSEVALCYAPDAPAPVIPPEEQQRLRMVEALPSDAELDNLRTLAARGALEDDPSVAFFTRPDPF